MVGERLRTLREQRGESQAVLAELCSVGQKAISRWELGVNEPNNDTLILLANHYSVTTDYLLGRSPLPNVYAHDIGEVRGQGATLFTTVKDAPTEADKARIIANAQAPSANVIDLKKIGMPSSREELEAIVRRLIAEAGRE